MKTKEKKEEKKQNIKQQTKTIITTKHTKPKQNQQNKTLHQTHTNITIVLVKENICTICGVRAEQDDWNHREG